jgi:hypothetical protein
MLWYAQSMPDISDVLVGICLSMTSFDHDGDPAWISAQTKLADDVGDAVC